MTHMMKDSWCFDNISIDISKGISNRRYTDNVVYIVDDAAEKWKKSIHNVKFVSQVCNELCEYHIFKTNIIRVYKYGCCYYNN